MPARMDPMAADDLSISGPSDQGGLLAARQLGLRKVYVILEMVEDKVTTVWWGKS